MPTYRLGNGDQTFRSNDVPDWDVHGSKVFGGTGDDDISVHGFDLVLRGGTGDDSVAAAGSGNRLAGGTGDDWVGANGLGNTLLGGTGDDLLLSTAGGGTFEAGAGNILVGGLGDDTFAPVGSKDLVAADDDGDGVVSNGDVVAGVFDVIEDYGAGDALQTGATTRVERVGFDPVPIYDHGSTRGHEHLAIGAGEYAVFEGRLEAPGRFRVSEKGDDLLAVWDAGPNDDHVFQWGVVLEGVSDAGRLWVV